VRPGGCPRGRQLRLRAGLGGGWLGERSSPARVPGERRRAAAARSQARRGRKVGLIGVAQAGNEGGSSGRLDHGGTAAGSARTTAGRGVRRRGALGCGSADSAMFPSFEAPWGTGGLGNTRDGLGNVRRAARTPRRR
jgi:hypothetical protein